MIVVTLKEVRESNLDEVITARDISPLVADAIFREVETPKMSCYFCRTKPNTRRRLYAYFIQDPYIVEVCCTKCNDQLITLISEGQTKND